MFDMTEDGSLSLGKWVGGAGTFWANGTFGGGTLSLHSRPPGATNFQTIGSGSDLAALSASGCINFSHPPGWDLLAVLAGSTAPDIEGDVGGMRV